MSMHPENARESLDKVAQELAPTFSKIGYHWVPGSEGNSSGGTFANGHFVGPAGYVGLIWRLGSGLGGVTYGPKLDGFGCSHEDLMRHLGVEKAAHFRFNESKWTPVAKKGSSLTAALAHDIEAHISEVLTAPKSVLEQIASDAQKRFVQHLHDLASNRRM